MNGRFRGGLSRRRLASVVLASAIGFLAMPRAARAQHPLSLSDLHGHASPALEDRMRVFVDSATAAGLPASPLIDKALEGTSKHAPEDRIVTVVQSVLTSLRTARRALGASAADAELTSAVVVLRAGVAPDALANARRQLPGRSLAVPLSVLGSLVAAGVPVSTAESAVVARAREDDDAAMLAFGRAVERSIAAGMPMYSAPSICCGPTETGAPVMPRPKP